jgi:hypothetical protein
MQAETQVVAEYQPWLIAGLVAALIAALVVLWIWLKGRQRPGDHVFRASRLSRGNRIFPAQVAISPNSITLYKPQFVGKLENSIHLAHVASIKIDTNLIFSDVFIETSGGVNPVVCHGHTKGDAVRIKELIEKYQTEHYRR